MPPTVGYAFLVLCVLSGIAHVVLWRLERREIRRLRNLNNVYRRTSSMMETSYEALYKRDRASRLALSATRESLNDALKELGIERDKRRPPRPHMVTIELPAGVAKRWAEWPTDQPLSIDAGVVVNACRAALAAKQGAGR